MSAAPTRAAEKPPARRLAATPEWQLPWELADWISSTDASAAAAAEITQAASTAGDPCKSGAGGGGEQQRVPGGQRAARQRPLALVDFGSMGKLGLLPPAEALLALLLGALEAADM